VTSAVEKRRLRSGRAAQGATCLPPTGRDGRASPGVLPRCSEGYRRPIGPNGGVAAKLTVAISQLCSMPAIVAMLLDPAVVVSSTTPSPLAHMTDGEGTGTATSAGERCKRTGVKLTVEGQIVLGQATFERNAPNIYDTVDEHGAAGATTGFSRRSRLPAKRRPFKSERTTLTGDVGRSRPIRYTFPPKRELGRSTTLIP
jgi:hypothetical protein